MSTKITTKIVSSPNGVSFEHSREINASAHDIVRRELVSLQPGVTREIISDGVLKSGREALPIENSGKEEVRIDYHTDGGVFHAYISPGSQFDIGDVKISFSADGVPPANNLVINKVDATNMGEDSSELTVVIIQL